LSVAAIERNSFWVFAKCVETQKSTPQNRVVLVVVCSTTILAAKGILQIVLHIIGIFSQALVRETFTRKLSH